MDSNVVSIVRSDWATGNLRGRRQAEQIISDLRSGDAAPTALRVSAPRVLAEQVGFFQRIAEEIIAGQTSPGER